MRKSWPELYEAHGTVDMPPIEQFKREAAEMAAEARAGMWVPMRAPVRKDQTGSMYGNWQPDYEFKVEDRDDFLSVPCVGESIEPMLEFLDSRGLNEEQAKRLKLAHFQAVFHNYLWRLWGRRVYALDWQTYEMLARTPLPNLPATLLSAPVPAFYILFPPGAFGFAASEGWSGATADSARPTNGISVVIDRADAGWEGSRKVALMAATELDERGIPRIACPLIRLGPDGRLSDIRLYSEDQEDGDLELLVPRIVFGLMLYLASEHPDIKMVKPERRDLSKIKNPAKRRKAEKEQERTTQRTYYAVSVRSDDARTSEYLKGSSGRKLDHLVWVSGHWRQQAYGPQHAYRKPLWIKPFLRGPDMAESLRARIGRVPVAEAK